MGLAMRPTCFDGWSRPAVPGTSIDVCLAAMISIVAPLLLTATLKAGEPENPPPNIVYIMLDDAGYGDFGATGSQFIETPTFDRLCREGQFFSNHYSGSAVCAPTRCVLMTGLHTGHCKRRDNQVTANRADSDNGLIFLDQDDTTVAKQLQQAGYVTIGIGKWGLGNRGSTGTPDQQGFDYFLGYLDQVHAHDHYTDWLWNDGQQIEFPGNQNGQRETYIHDVFEQATLELVRRYAEQRHPFFLYLPYTLPHGKYEIPPTDPALKRYEQYQDWPDNVRNYAAMVTRADRTVGKLMDLLKELNIDDNTIVFYTSDNGPNQIHDKWLNSSGPFRGIKRQLTEGGLRAPMVVRWPGKIKGSTTSDFAWSMVDVFPTLCEIAGAPVPPNLDGQSVLPTLLGKEQPAIDHIYFEIHHPFQQAVRYQKWKGFRTGTDDPLQLYNVQLDPEERQNVAQKNPAVVKRIESIMAAERVDSKFYPAVKSAKSKRRANRRQQ